MDASWRRHKWRNRFQSALLLAALLGISVLAGWLLAGPAGLSAALIASAVAILIEPAAAPRLTLALYGARPIARGEAPALFEIVRRLAARAGLPAPPGLLYVPSAVVNAFAVGGRRESAIALSDGLLRQLDLRELSGVLAHEIAHVAQGDLQVMGLADYVSRLTHLFAMAGQLTLLFALPALAAGMPAVNPIGLLVLVLSPHLALLAQLGLSRVREFDADLSAAELTGDPAGLAKALAKIERVGRSWRAWAFPGWGNPEPSWLRTHPPTEERVRRLLSLGQVPADRYSGAWLPPIGASTPVPSRPRWRLGGHWR